MGFRFKKSVRLGKGVRLNLGRKSVGVSLGGRHGGVSINSRSGARVRASIPGTGISYSAKLGGGKKRKSASPRSKASKASSSYPPKNTQRAVEQPKRAPNPPKPPKSPKLYFSCGIIMVVLGIILLFLLLPLGLAIIAIGVYYITCGPKIYADLVRKYKAVHPEFEENI